MDDEEALRSAHSFAKEAAVSDLLGNEEAGKPLDGEAIRALEERCGHICDQISQIHYDLKKANSANVQPATQLKMQQERIRHMRAAIQVEKDRKINALPQDSTILHGLLKDDMRQSVTQLQFALAAVYSQRRELKEKIQRERQLLEEHRQMKDALEKNITVAVNRQRAEVTESSYLTEQNEKVKKATKYLQRLMGWMIEFIGDHYPPPTAEQTAKWRKKNRNMDGFEDMTTVDFLRLEQIIESLLNKVIESPHDPYVHIVREHWPPYIELLLRCGIALKHPEDDNRIKMTPYHY